MNILSFILLGPLNTIQLRSLHAFLNIDANPKPNNIEIIILPKNIPTTLIHNKIAKIFGHPKVHEIQLIDITAEVGQA